MLADECQKKEEQREKIQRNKELEQLWLFIIDKNSMENGSMKVSEWHPVACHCVMRERSV